MIACVLVLEEKTFQYTDVDIGKHFKTVLEILLFNMPLGEKYPAGHGDDRQKIDDPLT